ncbi:hypothetical protein [Ottowia sp.]|uniref:hypothetical protein n=1 Tax=Ottowia sp. TaxID=1898956 RepID=UPI003A890D92
MKLRRTWLIACILLTLGTLTACVHTPASSASPTTSEQARPQGHSGITVYGTADGGVGRVSR